MARLALASLLSLVLGSPSAALAAGRENLDLLTVLDRAGTAAWSEARSAEEVTPLAAEGVRARRALLEVRLEVPAVSSVQQR